MEKCISCGKPIKDLENSLNWGINGALIDKDCSAALYDGKFYKPIFPYKGYDTATQSRFTLLLKWIFG